MAKRSIGKTIVLLLLIIILVLAGLLIFDAIGLIHVKNLFSPVNRLLRRPSQTSSTVVQSDELSADIYEDRLNKQLEAIDDRLEELDKREADLRLAETQNEQIAAELAEREKNQEEREKTFNQTVEKYENRDINIEQIANNLNGMRPQAAVAILEAMDDQLVIDVLRKVEELSAKEGTNSMGSYWLSLLPSERAAEIQRKMTVKPENLD